MYPEGLRVVPSNSERVSWDQKRGHGHTGGGSGGEGVEGFSV